MSNAYAPLEAADLPPATGLLVLHFGTNWCGVCKALGPGIEAGLAGSSVPHIKVEDGKGRPLGRAHKVKLWPTLVFLRDGVEVNRLVRPSTASDVAAALREFEASS